MTTGPESWDRMVAEHDKLKIMTRPRQRGYLNALGVGNYRGYDWYVSHNTIGFRCGYVKISRGHPWWMMPYNDLNEFINVHGGLTYAEKGPPGKIPKFSYVWWIGFDCGHAYDAPDPELIPKRTFDSWELIKQETDGRIDTLGLLSRGNVVRTQEYVEDECINIIKQAIMVGGQR